MEIKQKKCKNCKALFKPYTSLQKYCTNSECLKVFIEHEKAKKWAKTKSKMKAELMTLGDYIKLAQIVFNKWIRERDKGGRCVSCDKELKAKYDAGHYFNANNHWNVRFDEENVHGQCVFCNQHQHGNIAHYRMGLINRIGKTKVEQLECRAMITRKFTIDEVKEIIAKYKTLI